MGQDPQILIVDDEPQLRRILKASLLTQGYEVRVAGDGDSALQIFREWNPALVITDLSMPNMGGIELCRRLRDRSQVPIIVLSVKEEEQTKIAAFEAGADDYITKPFSTKELLARVKVSLRRAGGLDTPKSVIQGGDFRVDVAARRVWVRELEVHLTPKEFDLVIYFLKRPGAVITHRALLGAIWGPDNVGNTECLRVCIAQLRKKIEQQHALPRYIVTEPWIGYRFEPGA